VELSVTAVASQALRGSALANLDVYPSAMVAKDKCAATHELEDGTLLRCMFRAGHDRNHGAPRPPTVDEPRADPQLHVGDVAEIGLIYWENRLSS
jgi:hypothetical protein